MIEFNNVSKTYNKDKEDEVKALKNVNLTFGDNGLYFITGKSGSGKSTMLNILGGLDSVSNGQVIVDGEGFDNFSPSQLDEYRKNKVGFIFQNFNLIEELTVEENIALALDLKGEKEDGAAIAKALKAVDLEGYEKRKASKLSGGQKQRVAVARALVKCPDIILADEPTGNLDSATSQTIFELLKELSKERLVIVVSHDGESVKKYADTIIECVDGEVTLKENNKQDEESVLKRTKLNELPSKGISARNIVKLGLKFALRHKFRMIVTLILFVFALSFIGVAVTMAQSNNVSVEYSNLISKGEKIVHIGVKLSPDSNLHNVNRNTISNENAKKICDELADFKFNKIYYNTGFNGADYLPEYRDNDNFHTNWICGVTALTDDDLTRFGMTMLAGRLPNGKHEVAIPAYICDSYLEYGLYNWEEDEEEPITSYDAIIGKSYGRYYKIVGVVDTGFDTSVYLPLKHVSESMTQDEYSFYRNLKVELQDATSHSIHNCIFVSQYYIDFYYTLPTATVIRGSIEGKGNYYVYNLIAQSYVDMYTQEEGYQITKVKDFTTLADDEIIFNRTRLFMIYFNYYNKTPYDDEELKDFCLNHKITLQFREDEEPKEFKIVGIIDDRGGSYPYFAPHLIMSKSFLSQYDYEDDVILSLFTPLSGDKNKDKKLVALSQSYDIDENYYFPIYWSAMEGLDIGYTFVNVIKYFGVGTGVVFLIFTILMIINYISATISSSKKQIGVLKALGAGNKELISIFSVEAMLIGLIGFVLAILLAVGWIALCNWFMIHFNNVAMGMEVNWLSALALFGVSAVTCALGSILPIKRLLKKKPIDIINN